MAGKILIKLNWLLFGLFCLLNLIQVFMPELGFDALWYHLTLSKLYLIKHQWYFPGGLFYYSAMPRLGELISLPFFSLVGFVGPKMIQLLAGIVVSRLIYKLASKFTGNKLLTIVAVNLFYGTWLVSWQSSSAYVDLTRTAFEISAFYLLVVDSTRRRQLLAGVLFGLAVGVKWHALGSLFLASLIFTPMIIIPALITATPWFLTAYHFTGNPLYPLFEKFMTQTQMAQVSANFYSLIEIAKRFILTPLFITKPTEDFLSPVIGLVFLISLLALLSFKVKIRKIALYGVLGTFLLLLTPPPSTRYYLPYLPAVIVAAVYTISRLKEKYSHALVILFTLSAILILGMRLFAFKKYLPYCLHQTNLNRFLASQSGRLPGTFIDADNYVSQNLPPTAHYLIGNLHNLYYFPYDFDHITFQDQKKHYDYLITTGESPDAIDGQLIHTNPLGIQIFKL